MREAAAALLMLSGCATPAPVAMPISKPASQCGENGERLEAAAQVRAGPGNRWAVVTELDAGRWVLSCGTAGGFRAIYFAEKGERNDCTARDAAHPCASGWIAESVPTLKLD
jgi:hypothetical protein